ncbi:MAG: sugar phosphate isomerase/epimerase [Chloroflexi bacterium OHK40]
MAKPPPLIGAAIPSRAIPEHREWLLSGQRDLELQDPVQPEVLDGDWRPLVRQIRDQLDGYTGRLGIHGPFMSLTILGYDPKIRAVVAERIRQALAFGAELGAGHMVIHSPFIFFGSPFLPHAPSAGQQEQLKLIAATLEPIIPLAEQARCTLVIENIQDTNPGPLLAVVRSFGSEYVRMSLDTGHAFITQRIGGPTPDQWVREAGPLLGHLHLQDSDGHLDRHWAPGDGAINWYALFEALGELEQSPRLVLELRDHTRIRRGAEYLVSRGLAR